MIWRDRRLKAVGRLTTLQRVGTGAVAFCLLVLLGLALHVLAPLAAGLDHRLIDDVVAGRTGTLTSVAHAASMLGRSWFLIVATSALALVLLRQLAWSALGPLIAVLGAELLQHVVKDLVQRPRPPVLHLEHVTGSSFPSGHATESAAVAAALVCMARSRPRRERFTVTILCVLAVGAIGVSRVYLGVHYPTDVIAGALLGSAWGATVALLLPSASGERNG